MSAGIFSEIGKLYMQAAGNGFYFTGNRSWLGKPFWFLIAIAYGFVLLIVSLIFYLLIVLDWLGNITDTIRKSLLKIIDSNTYKIQNSFFLFISSYPHCLAFTIISYLIAYS